MIVLKIIGSIVAIIVGVLIYSNITVMLANRWFYNELLKKGYGAMHAKEIMLDENDAYSDGVTSRTLPPGIQLKGFLRMQILNY